ncbi:Vacuolar amino acid transporter 1 [Nymphaea thermarum]|nr:Vacuolar amino acid transporter 1 [Nymphaea thermarum]
MLGVGILTTPFTIKGAGWANLLVLTCFAAMCCYTGILMGRCMRNRIGIISYPDIGEAAYGKYGRFLILYNMDDAPPQARPEGPSILPAYGASCICVKFIILEGDNLTKLYPGASIDLAGIHT